MIWPSVGDGMHVPVSLAVTPKRHPPASSPLLQGILAFRTVPVATRLTDTRPGYRATLLGVSSAAAAVQLGCGAQRMAVLGKDGRPGIAAGDGQFDSRV